MVLFTISFFLQEIIWMSMQQLNEEDGQNSNFHWMPIQVCTQENTFRYKTKKSVKGNGSFQILEFTSHPVSGTLYKLEVLMAESNTKKTVGPPPLTLFICLLQDIEASVFGTATNPQVREGAERRIYQIEGWLHPNPNKLITIEKVRKIRDVGEGETFSDSGWLM